MEKKSSSSKPGTTTRMVSMVPPRSMNSPTASPASSSSSAQTAPAITLMGPPAKKRKLKQRKDLPHVAERLSRQSLQRYLRYYKLKPKSTALLRSDVAHHFDALHVDEKEVVTRFCQTTRQLSREKRRK